MLSMQERVQQLQRRIHGLERARPSVGAEVLASGCLPLDRLFPGGGLPRGALSEWLAADAGSGAAMLALQYARRAVQAGGTLVVVDRQRRVYPPALAAWGVDLARVVLVYPENQADEAWTWDQALRCPAVAAGWGWVERLDDRRFRRWQLAAETGGGRGLLIRPGPVRSQPTWAEVRLWIEPCAGGGMRVCVLHRRGGDAQHETVVALDEGTGQLREVRTHATATGALAAQLARATAPRRATGTHGAGVGGL
jgi:hypothetical protein